MRCWLVVLICVSLMISNVKHFLVCLLPSAYLLWKMSAQIFCLLFNQAVFFVFVFFFFFFWYWIVWAVYVFWMLVCYCSYYLQLFSPRSCLFILSMVSFALQKLLNLITSNLLIFASVSFALGDRSKKHHCYNLCQRVFCLCSLLKFSRRSWSWTVKTYKTF